ncbi:response regulator [Algoriphagus sp. AK58]|uniref:response regulator n=1 Tax=Algoriphagus sp. AK58 TaxID=1406877 RepID=UPI00164FEC8B|nr:response regulator [Algoriphagus sp. AK58]MBC6367389.1 hypothetical protein [Algoriphagus sp. AK58]
MSNFSQKQIIVVDDDKIQHLLIRKKIQLLFVDVQIHFFESAESVIDSLKSNPVDIIITDLNLDMMDGWDFVQELENIGFKGKLYIVTGSIMASDRIRAEGDPRISGFFEKPLSETDLLQILSP